jgi:hypothetical protein
MRRCINPISDRRRGATIEQAYCNCSFSVKRREPPIRKKMFFGLPGRRVSPNRLR